MMTSLRGMVQHNLPIKIAALIVAVVLWLYVMNDQNPAIDGSYQVPVTIENAPEGYQLGSDTDKVTIRVRGPRSLFGFSCAREPCGLRGGRTGVYG